ncbi:PrsW family intramembrane metalloprotease [Halalkaliarchaeum desulfuricum]|nr:PrsW family intramembrane metalloprotease [Halalkaliarchaeum desulfuricum]
MSSREDPIQAAVDDDDRDLYDVATWEERTSLDGLAVALHWLFVRGAKLAVVLLAALILVSIGAIGVLSEPPIAFLTLLSAIPALGLTGYVWYSDVTTSEPLSLLVATFLLAVLTATFAAVVNGLAQGLFAPLGGLGLLLFFYLVVGPVEETVKLLAVRLYAYTDKRFDAVIDGAVYGAVAGLGFATIENSLYIARNVEIADLTLGIALVGAGDGIAGIRALAGPGHVIYSAYAGYYLGLAKFNPENRGPIIIKGLLIAAVIHATYNATAGFGTATIMAGTGLPFLAAFALFVVLYQGFFGGILLRKLWQYRTVYLETRGGTGAETAAGRANADEDPTEPEAAEPELTEFEE